jgi:hypothetical protein
MSQAHKTAGTECPYNPQNKRSAPTGMFPEKLPASSDAGENRLYGYNYG